MKNNTKKNMQKIHCVAGVGEVGGAVLKVLKQKYKAFGLNKDDSKTRPYDVLHICFPYSRDFIKKIKEFNSDKKLIIIHSTVPIGISRKLNAVHSPIRGIHPNLYGGIKTFVKYFGGARANEAARYFRRLGVKCVGVKDSETTEALKLWDTTQYGWMIILNKEIKKWCDKHKVDFNTIYSYANQTYNKGYVKLNKKEVVRPFLKYMEGKIGGHCVMPNADLLKSSISRVIQKFNKEY